MADFGGVADRFLVSGLSVRRRTLLRAGPHQYLALAAGPALSRGRLSRGLVFNAAILLVLLCNQRMHIGT